MVVTDIERNETERRVTVKAESLHPGDRPLHYGEERLIAARYLGECECGRVCSALGWKLIDRYTPIRRQRQLARLAAQPFQDEGGLIVPLAGGAYTACPDCGTGVRLSEVQGEIATDVPCDVRCTSARRHDCKCSCGGANHGSDWA